MQNEDFEAMGTPELDRLLQEELAKDDTDAGMVRQIAAVLKERDKNKAAEMTPEIQATLDEFKARDHRRQEQDRPLVRGWVRFALAAVAAVFLMLMVLPMEVEAETWLEKLQRLTDSVLEYFSSTEATEVHSDYVFRTDNPGLQKVYDAVVELGITEPVVPMWLPEGYALNEIKNESIGSVTRIYANFSMEEKQIIFQLNLYSKEVWREYHKNEGYSAEYENSGIVHNIVQNKEKSVAVWATGKAECVLSVDESMDSLCEIIDSIYMKWR